MRLRHSLLVALSFLLALPAVADTLLIAAGAGYKRPMAELATAFERKTGTHIEQIYGHMAGVISQAKQSGQVAIIFGDKSYLEKVDGLAFAGFLPVGEGRLVVAWPRGSSLSKPADLAESRFTRIAMPDTKAAIYGIAATEFLKKSQLDTRIKDKLQVVSTVPQVSAYLVSGEIDAGFINLTEALGIKDKIGGYQEIDQSQYSPIHIVGAVVQGFENAATVKALQQFIESPEARAIAEKHGL